MHATQTELTRTRTQLVVARQSSRSVQQLLESPDSSRNVRRRFDNDNESISEIGRGVPSASTAAPCIADNVTANPATARVVPIPTVAVASVPPTQAAATENTTVTAVTLPPALPTLDSYGEVPVNVPPSQRQVGLLTWNATAQQVNNPRSRLSRGVKISDVLQLLYSSNCFVGLNGKWRNMSVPKQFSDPSLVKNTL